LNGAVFFVDDLQNITSLSKADLALTITDQFQSLGVEGMNYSVCFSAKPDYFAETKALAEPAVRFYTKLYLEAFTLEETIEYTRAVFGTSLDPTAIITAWLHEKTLGRPHFLAFVCKYLSATASQMHPHKLDALPGSLALTHSRCGKPTCRCARGEGGTSLLLADVHGGWQEARREHPR
jgi:hypothetical protein